MATAAEARQQAEKDQLPITARMDQAHRQLEELEEVLSKLEQNLIPVLTPENAQRGLVSTQVDGISSLSASLAVLADRIEHITAGVRDLTQRVEL